LAKSGSGSDGSGSSNIRSECRNDQDSDDSQIKWRYEIKGEREKLSISFEMLGGIEDDETLNVFVGNNALTIDGEVVKMTLTMDGIDIVGDLDFDNDEDDGTDLPFPDNDINGEMKITLTGEGFMITCPKPE